MDFQEERYARGAADYDRRIRSTATDARIRDLQRTGKLRVALYPPQYARVTVSGDLRGWTIELGRALAARIGIEFLTVEYSTPPQALDAVKTGACDVGCGAMDASRNSEIDFSPPVLQFDFTYLVPTDSSLCSVADADHPGVRIAVVRNHASTLCLNRVRKCAELISAETPDLAFDLLRTGLVDAWASTRPALLEYSAKLAGSRVLEDFFGANFTAMTVPKGHPGRLAYVSEFIEEAKASGLVRSAIVNSGWHGVHVAPPGYPAIPS
jgi:polar amino acid transport system substrate-binding protein